MPAEEGKRQTVPFLCFKLCRMLWLPTHICWKGEPELQPGWLFSLTRGREKCLYRLRRETGFAHLQDQSVHGLKYWFLAFYFLEPSYWAPVMQLTWACTAACSSCGDWWEQHCWAVVSVQAVPPVLLAIFLCVYQQMCWCVDFQIPVVLFWQLTCWVSLYKGCC